MANHRRAEAVDILCKIRGDKDINDPSIAKELELLEAVVEASHHKRNDYINIFLGGRFSGKLHLGRRAVLGLALQQIQQWTGILVMVSWACLMLIWHQQEWRAQLIIKPKLKPKPKLAKRDIFVLLRPVHEMVI